jgi:hypothetical protein
MSRSARRSAASRKRAAPAPGDPGATIKPSPQPRDRDGDSEAVERAVYDGMQDLRARK